MNSASVWGTGARRKWRRARRRAKPNECFSVQPLFPHP
uniref:Uncharacterized protein n=1 Tax=Anguilla anguilla TaxID=7936 RepID=A0A0E9W3L2_ANGAN